MKKIVFVWLLMLGYAAPLRAHAPALPEDISSLRLQQLSENVFVLEGPQAFPSPATAGFMNNPGFVRTPEGIVVIDPGSSVQIGQLLLQKIREVSGARLLAVFNTHVHGDHWLGNQAIREAEPEIPIYAHQRMIERIGDGEGDAWIDTFMKSTDGAVAGTRVVAPSIGLEGGERLALGGVEFLVHHTGRAHTDHDIMIEYPREKSLFLGDIVTSQRVQSARPADSDIRGQIAAIEYALDLDVEVYIPGHGTAAGREMVIAQLRFLQVLYASVAHHYEAGLSDYEMKPLVEQDIAAYESWQNFDELGRVISHVYLQVEEDAF